MYEFEYLKPGMLSEAATLLGHHPEAMILAGGMTLVPTLKQRLARPSHLIELGGLAGLRGIKVSPMKVTIGAMTTHATVARSEELRRALPALAHLAAGIGDPHVRHRGTIGGSIANNDPAADYPAAVLALNATITTNHRQIPADDFFTGMFETALEPSEIVVAVTAKNTTSKRKIGADAFFTGMFETALGADEIIVSVSFPVPKKAAYAKFPNPASRFALVGVFVAQTAAGVRVAVTGAASKVFRAKSLEDALAKDWSSKAAKAIKVDAHGLNTDLHGSPAYRAHLIAVMASRAVDAAH